MTRTTPSMKATLTRHKLKLVPYRSLVGCMTCDDGSSYVVMRNADVECSYCGCVKTNLLTPNKQSLKSIGLRAHPQCDDVCACAMCGDFSDFDILASGDVTCGACSRIVGKLGKQ